MKTFALCSPEQQDVVRRAAGVEPHLSPPVSLDLVTPSLFGGYDLLYFKLIGVQGEPYWWNEDGYRVVSADVLSEADLSGAVVFSAACYLPETPMLDALLDAGADYVIGGAGLNYYWPKEISGVDLLGLMVRWLLEHGTPPKWALMIAKGRLFIGRRDKVNEDTRQFTMWKGRNVT
jgi:hypothetical protein